MVFLCHYFGFVAVRDFLEEIDHVVMARDVRFPSGRIHIYRALSVK
jgi:hypothetical protein